MKIIWKVNLLIGLLLLLSACQTTPIKTTPIGQEPIRTNPVDVQTNFINQQAITPQALDTASGNLFSNGGFESGLEGWTACNAGAIKPSSDVFEGSGALEVIPNNCFYRSAEVSAGQDLVLSCYVKVTSGSAWTGMGMGFADSSWTTVGEAPTTVISGSEYARYDVEFTAPENSKYASMWLYSDNAVVVDNCSLMLEAVPPPPPPPSGDNLLENGSFETLSSGSPTEWSQGCGGSASSVVGREGNGFSLKGGICVDQGLGAGDIAALSGNDYTYSCYAKNTGGYASLSIFFNDSPVSKVIPLSDSFQLVELKGTAPQASSGFVSIYSEANLVVDQCTLTTDDTAPPSGNNFLENGDFEILDTNEKPVNWTKGCSGEYSRSFRRNGNSLQLTGGACIDQSLNIPNLSTFIGQQYTYSCYVRKLRGYAAMSIFFDSQATSTVIPENPYYQLVKVTGVITDATSGFVSIYSEAELNVDNCSLVISESLVQEPTIITEGNVVEVNVPFRFPYTNIYDIENNLLVVGFPAEFGEVSGKVVTYIKSEISWIQENILESPIEDNFFGRAVKIDGDFLYVTGANGLYIFKDTDNQWILQQSISSDVIQLPDFLVDNVGESFGQELFVNDDFLIVVSRVSRNLSNSSGSYEIANIYTRSQESWQYIRSIASLHIITDVMIQDNYVFIATTAYLGSNREIIVLNRNTNNWEVSQIIPNEVEGVRTSNFGIELNFYKGNLIAQGFYDNLVFTLDNDTANWQYLGTFSDVYRDLEEVASFIPFQDYDIIGILDNKMFLSYSVSVGTPPLNTFIDAIDVIDVSDSPNKWKLISQINTEGLGANTGLRFEIEKEFSAFAITSSDTNSIVGFPLP